MAESQVEYFKKWDEDIDNFETDKKKLYDEMFEKFEKSDSKCVDNCWRLVKASIVVADANEAEKNKNEAKKWIEKSYEHAKKAIELDDKCMHAHKWFCASVGRMASHVGAKERVNFGHQFKEHRDIAVEMDPNDHLMHHMYGRWCYEVASISFIEKKLAQAFFGAPPTSSYDEALQSLLKADELRPDWKANYLWIAKTYIALKKYEDAIKWIDSGLKFPVKNEEDAVGQKELEGLEKSYSKYRAKN